MSSIAYAALAGYISGMIFVLLIVGYLAFVKKHEMAPEGTSLAITLMGVGMALLVCAGLMLWDGLT